MVGSDVVIEKLDRILLPNIVQPSTKILKYETRRLTAPGENYGSLMLALDITVLDTKTKKQKTINAVAKMVPDNEVVQKLFQSPLTFRKELGLYNTVVPALKEFQRENGVNKVVDFFPEYYGGRLCLNGNEVFDSNAVILLENLKARNYVNEERTLGFDFPTAKFLLKKLAEFHAVPLAMKIKQPEMFNEKVKPYINDVDVFNKMDENTLEDMYREKRRMAEADPECIAYADAIEKAIRHASNCVKNREINELWATLVHCDFWVNNMLIKHDPESNKVVSCKIVDYQVTNYMSVGKDISFFLFSSVRNSVIGLSYNALIKEYHEAFTTCLKQYDVDTAPYTLTSLEEDIGYNVERDTMWQCFGMIGPIFAEADSVVNADELKMEDLKNAREKEPSPLYKEKFRFLVKEFAKRKWLQK